LINNQDPEIATLVDDVVRGDRELKSVYVLARDRGVITYCAVRSAQGTATVTAATAATDGSVTRGAAGGDRTCDHSAYPTPHQPIHDPSWALAQDAWRRTGQPLAAIELPKENAAVFVYPVMTEGAPTAQAALAADPPRALKGYVGFSYDLSPVDSFRAASDREKAAASFKAAVRTGGVGAIFVLLGTVLAILQGLSISRPIKQLAYKADQIAHGDLSTRAEVTSTDEIGVLGQSFNHMADQITVLLEETAAKAHIEKELEVARKIQEALVAPNTPVEVGPLQVAGYCQAASQCGGDWWSWYQLGPDRLLVVIGDVTGHGVPAAMITATAKAACDVARSEHGERLSAQQLLGILNYAIHESGHQQFMMTCFAAILDTSTWTLTGSNAGHQAPYLYRAAPRARDEFQVLASRPGDRLGDHVPAKLGNMQHDLKSGDVLVWYTDGVTECVNAEHQQYGEKRLRAAIRKVVHLDAAGIRDAVIEDALGFFGDMPRRDDLTLVVAKVA